MCCIPKMLRVLIVAYQVADDGNDDDKGSP